MKKLFNKVKCINSDEKDAIKKFNSFYKLLSSAKMNAVSFSNESLSSKSVFQFESFVQLNLYRYLDLIDEISFSCNRKNFSSAILALRAAMEITAVFYDVISKIEMYIRNKNFTEIEKLLYNRLFGSRYKPGFEKSQNVLTAIQKAAKNQNDYLNDYETLSDYCHPSYLVYINFYGEYSDTNSRLSLSNSYSKDRFNFALIIKPLAGTFQLYLNSISLVESLKVELNEIDWENILEKDKNLNSVK